jgi:hypothetical protein
MNQLSHSVLLLWTPRRGAVASVDRTHVAFVGTQNAYDLATAHCPGCSLNGVARERSTWFLACFVALQEPLQQIRGHVECRLLQTTKHSR